MVAQVQSIETPIDFRIKSTLGVTIISLILLTPFAVNNLLQGRTVLGIGISCIVILSAFGIWSSIRKHYYPLLILLGIVPAIIFSISMALQQQGAIITYWCYVALLSFYFMLSERRAWISNIVFLAIIFPQAWGVLEQPFMIRFVVTILGVSAFSAMFLRVISTQQKMLMTQAVTDPLTGLLNRMTLNDTLEQIIQQSHRTGIAMTIAILDIDHFKMVNDKLGHDSGDKVLRSVGEFLNKRIHRRTDKVFRIGGEEFLVLLYDTNIEDGLQVAEELRSGFGSLTLLPDHPITTSIGIASLQPNDNWEDWMKRCDENLYKAKLDGRNKVVS